MLKILTKRIEAEVEAIRRDTSEKIGLVLEEALELEMRLQSLEF